jgi:hypothetical protein
MKPPTRATPALDKVVASLAAVARGGRGLASVEDIAPGLGIDPRALRQTVRRCEALGLLRIERLGRTITAIMAGDGAWRVPVRRPGTGSEAARRCLRCRETFRPESRGRFLCDGCNRFAQNAG